MKLNKNKNVSYGDNSIGIGNAKKVTINYDKQQDIAIEDYEKRKIKELKINPKKLSLIGVFGAGATFLTYLGLFVKFPILEFPRLMTYLPLVTMVFLLLFVIGGILKNRKYIPLPQNFSIESDGNNISLRKTKIKCPKCSSKMRISQNQNGIFIICSRNPEQHIFMFDYTTFTNNK